MTQTELPLASAPPECVVDKRWPELLELLAVTASEWNRSKVADKVDLSLSALNNALLDRDRHSLKAKHLFYFLLRSPRVLAWIAEMAGYTVERTRPRSAEEKLAALEAAVRSMGAMGDQLLELAGVGK
jgi:hypothetical protein